MKMTNLYLSGFFVLLCQTVFAQKLVPLNELEKHIGDTVTVCDSVIQTIVVKLIPESIGDPQHSTGLNLEGKGCPLKLGISIDNTKLKFPFKPEEVFKHKKICVTGVLKKIEYWNALTIELTDTKQIRIQDEAIE